MKVEIQQRIAQLAEQVYRVATQHPDDRDMSLNRMDQPAIDELRQVIETILREQESRTRHACAEAVAAIANEPTLSGSDSIKLVLTGFCQRAHDTIMNTQAI